MRSRVIAGVMLLASAIAAGASAEDLRPVLKRTYLLDGEVYATFLRQRPRPAVLSEQSPITGFAFGPGRLEIAYCASTAEAGRWGLWMVNARARKPEDSKDPRLYRTPLAPPRLVWTAPAGATLRGPIWWTPNGAQVAVRAFAGEQCALMSVDYATGGAVKLAEGGITAVAWSPDGKSVAFAMETDGTSAVWLQSFPPAEARRLGEGGLDLRWSVEGNTLSWIAPSSGETWTRHTWESGADQPESLAEVPARPKGTVWSPDGKLCAAVEGGTGDKHLVIYPAYSATGEAISLEGAHPERVLSWTPDSHLVTVLADRNQPVAVAATPEKAMPAAVMRVLKRDKTPYRSLRAALVGPPLASEAGFPSWSANGDMVAYVYRRGEGELSGFTRWYVADSAPEGLEELLKLVGNQMPTASTALLAVGIERYAIPYEAKEEARREEAGANGGEAARLRAKVLLNVKNIATALNMYLADYEVFPDIVFADDLRQALSPYLYDQSVFVLPGGDEPVVEYLLPPGLQPEDIEDPGTTPMVVVSALPGWDLVGFVDGHAKMCRKGEDYGLNNVPQAH